MTTPSIIPTMRYQDAPAAIEWLCQTLGFEKKVVYETEDGRIAHAQLTFGQGMIMLSSVREVEFDQFVKTPNEMNGLNTMSPYLIVKNVDEHYQRAVDQGAEIVIDLQTEDHGRGYSCRDTEGYLWNFGDYNPWLE